MFVPCEKVLTDLEGEEISLINLLDNVTLTVPKGVSVPKETEIPLHWLIFTQWSKLAQEINQSFEQRVQLVAPNGEIKFTSVDHLPQNTLFQRHVVRVTKFPVTYEGEYILHLSIRSNQSNQQWQMAGWYPITVVHEHEYVSFEGSKSID